MTKKQSLKLAYQKACVQLHACKNLDSWTVEDLQAVFALVDVPISFESWLDRIGIMPEQLEEPDDDGLTPSQRACNEVAMQRAEAEVKTHGDKSFIKVG